jgi:hypothetical protein
MRGKGSRRRFIQIKEQLFTHDFHYDNAGMLKMRPKVYFDATLSAAGLRCYRKELGLSTAK